MAWIYLFTASVFEIAWTFSLKFLDFKKIRLSEWRSLMPLSGYIVFGLCNIYFFSMAMKKIPASIAMAVWLGIALTGIKLVDIVYFREPFQTGQFIYFLLIIAGVIGLKSSS